MITEFNIPQRIILYMKITEHFHWQEFFCHDGTEITPDELRDNCAELADNLEVLRKELGKPIFIISGYRTPEYNKAVGGAEHSMHLEAKAADIMTKYHTPREIHNAIRKLIKEKKMKNGGLGLYKTFVHYDIGTARRWYY